MKKRRCFWNYGSECIKKEFFFSQKNAEGKALKVEEEKQLREMLQAKKSLVAMAKVFGKSVESVKQKSLGNTNVRIDISTSLFPRILFNNFQFCTRNLKNRSYAHF